MYSSFYEIWHLMQIEHANCEYSTWIDDLEPKLQIWANSVPTLKFAPIFIKFSTHNKAELNRSNISSNILDEMLDECWINVG